MASWTISGKWLPSIIKINIPLAANFFTGKKDKASGDSVHGWAISVNGSSKGGSSSNLLSIGTSEAFYFGEYENPFDMSLIGEELWKDIYETFY
jgi:hypothetical protein